MIFLYRIIINVILLLSPLIIIFRIIKKKEDLKRFKEKFCFFSKPRSDGKIVWFHGASVGELQSIVPLLEKYEKNKTIKQRGTPNNAEPTILVQAFFFSLKDE